MQKYVLLSVLAASVLSAQDLAFEVATIRPAAAINRQDLLSGNMTLGVSVNGNQVSIRYLSIRDLAAQAYGVKPFDVSGPDWLGQQRFDVTALMPEGATEKDLPQMLSALLKDRFKMVARKETKEAQVYALEVAPGGHKMKPAPEIEPPAATGDEQPAPDAAKPSGPGMVVNGQRLSIAQSGGGAGGANFAVTGGKNGTQRVSMGPDGQMHIEIERMTTKEIAETLTSMMDLPVEDRTGLTGAYSIGLDMSMGDLMGLMNRAGAATGAALPPEAQNRLAQIAANDPGGALPASIQKLGLRLEKKKGSIEGLVVESAAQMPTEN